MALVREIIGVTGAIIGVVVIAATLAPVSRAHAGWIRMLDFPRVQLAVAGTVAAGLILGGYGLAVGPTLLAVAALAAAVRQLVAIVPFTPFGRREVQQSREDGAPRLRLLVANVLQDNHRSDRLLAEIARVRPDVIIAMETDSWWESALSPLHDALPYQVSEPRPNTYGMILYSKLPLEDVEIHHLVEPDVPSFHVTLRLGAHARVRLHAVHPRPPVPGQRSAERDAELIVVGRMVRAEGVPAVVAGDLNDVAWSATTRLFRRVSGTLDPRRGRGVYASFHAGIPVLRFPLDHVFHTPELRLRSLTRLPNVGSDHFPVLVELAYEPEAVTAQPRPEPDQEDRKEARETLEEV